MQVRRVWFVGDPAGMSPVEADEVQPAYVALMCECNECGHHGVLYLSDRPSMNGDQPSLGLDLRFS